MLMKEALPSTMMIMMSLDMENVVAEDVVLVMVAEVVKAVADVEEVADVAMLGEDQVVKNKQKFPLITGCMDKQERLTMKMMHNSYLIT